MRKDGNLIIEYSDSGTRTFYGLKKNGRGMFENEETIKKINITKIKKGDDEIKGRYESRNILVSFKDNSSLPNILPLIPSNLDSLVLI